MKLPPLPEWAEVVADELANPRGMAFGTDGTPNVAVFGVVGNTEQMWRITPAALATPVP